MTSTNKQTDTVDVEQALLPCPWHPHSAVNMKAQGERRHWAQCYGGCRGPTCSSYSEAISAWNLRPKRNELLALLEEATTRLAGMLKGGERGEERGKLTPEYLAMSASEKWRTLAVNGLLGTNEPWIPDMAETLRALEAPAALHGPAVEAIVERCIAELEGFRAKDGWHPAFIDGNNHAINSAAATIRGIALPELLARLPALHGPTAWVRKAIAEQQKGKRVVLVYPVDKWLLMLLAAGAKVENLGDVKWVATEDGSTGKGTGRHIACFILEPATPPIDAGKK
jgi:hypothetical protein